MHPVLVALLALLLCDSSAGTGVEDLETVPAYATSSRLAFRLALAWVKHNDTDPGKVRQNEHGTPATFPSVAAQVQAWSAVVQALHRHRLHRFQTVMPSGPAVPSLAMWLHAGVLMPHRQQVTVHFMVLEQALQLTFAPSPWPPVDPMADMERQSREWVTFWSCMAAATDPSPVLVSLAAALSQGDKLRLESAIGSFSSFLVHT
jgi:hypothetical protein